MTIEDSVSAQRPTPDTTPGPDPMSEPLTLIERMMSTRPAPPERVVNAEPVPSSITPETTGQIYRTEVAHALGQVTEPSDRRKPRPDMPSLASRLIESGVLSEQQAARVVAHQIQEGCDFGEAAEQLGLISRDTHLHALAEQFGYACLPADNDSFSKELDVAFAPFGDYAESLRSLRSELLALCDGQPPVVAVVSPDRRDGRTRLAANLALTFAQLGTATLLIDADLRRPRLHRLFKLPNIGGLSTILLGRSFDNAVYHIPYFTTLTVIPSGPPPPNPQELLTGPAFASLMEAARGKYGAVLIDTSAATLCADWEWAAKAAGRAIVVTRREQTRRKGLSNLTRRLQDLDVIVSGCLLVA